MGCAERMSWGCGVKCSDARAALSLLPSEPALLNRLGRGWRLKEASNCFTVLSLLQETCTENPGPCVWHPSSHCALSLLSTTPRGKRFPASGSSWLLGRSLLCLVTAVSFSLGSIVWFIIKSHLVSHQIVNIWVRIALNPAGASFMFSSFCVHWGASDPTCVSNSRLISTFHKIRTSLICGHLIFPSSYTSSFLCVSVDLHSKANQNRCTPEHSKPVR